MGSPELKPQWDEGLILHLTGKPTFDLMVRSERLAAAAAILRMSGLLLDFMISRGGKRIRIKIKGKGREKV